MIPDEFVTVSLQRNRSFRRRKADRASAIQPWKRARAAYMARRGSDFGVVIDGTISIDMKQVKARKDVVVRSSTEGVENWLKNTPNLTVYEGHARFESTHRVCVNDELLEADRIFINTGARARIPDMPGLKEVTNSSMMEIDFLPEHLIIVGGSYIGLEFAQMYRRFGSRVTVVKMKDRLIARDDEDVSATVKEILEAAFKFNNGANEWLGWAFRTRLRSFL